jgi:hypothetical protein
MDFVRESMVRLARDNRPVTNRQLFYLLVSALVIEKLEREYKNTVLRLSLELRESGRIPWEWIVDETRFYFAPTTYNSLSEALEETARTYRRSLWTDADVNVQVWCESMSVAGIVKPVTSRWDVRLYPTRGYASHDFMRNAAREIARDGKSAQIYILGDYDPSGRDIIRFSSEMIRKYAREVDPDVNIEFETLAVTEGQILEWDLPSHPSKESDPRHKRGGIDYAVELEAIPPAQLRDLLEENIVQHLDPDELEALERVESLERQTMLDLAGGRWKL